MTAWWHRVGAPGLVAGARPSAPELVVTYDGTERRLSPGSYRVGRDPKSDVVVADSRVSWSHAVLRADGDAWFFEDGGSRNGTFADGARVERLRIDGERTVRLGDADEGPALTFTAPGPAFSWAPPGDGAIQPSRVDLRPTNRLRVPARTLRIGRALDNDHVVDDLGVSRHHAELRRTADGFQIVDLGSRNGTFLNGGPVFSAPVTERDLIGIGPATFRLVGEELQEFVDQGDVSFVARELTVRAGDRVRLDRVSFPVSERSLVAVIGPSGAGKSTLLGALTGLQPATQGVVLYDNRDLYAEYAELRHRIALVPQDDVIYPKLTPRRFLGYAAELRFPGEVTAAERGQRVQEVIDQLRLGGSTNDQPQAPADRPSAMLSGGQRKRVSIALELLTKPSVLFLDEPTSGLDPELKEDVVDSMRELVDDGRTVIMVTHDVEYLDKCDRVLVIVPGGKMAFYGPSEEGLRYFGKTRWVEVYRRFRDERERDWAEDFRQSSCYQQYVDRGVSGPAPASSRGVAEPPPAPRSRVAQLAILCRRYAALIAADRGFLATLVLLPLVLGVFTSFIAGGGLRGPGNSSAVTTLLVLAIIATFNGGFSSVRELVKERDIYRRERTAGLSAGAYLLSKVVVLGVITAVQGALLVAVSVGWKQLPASGAFLTSLPLVELMLGIAVLSVTSMALGLVVSAWATSQDQTWPALIILSILQLVMTGALMRLALPLKVIGFVIPARWGFAAVASTVDLDHIQQRGALTDPLWAHSPSRWLLAIAAQLALTAAFTLIAWWRLVQLSPGRTRRR